MLACGVRMNRRRADGENKENVRKLDWDKCELLNYRGIN